MTPVMADQLTDLVQTETYQQLLDELPWYLMQMLRMNPNDFCDP